MTDRPYPRGLAHVGLTVPDIEAAIEWYQDVLGYTLIRGPDTVVGGEGHGGRQAEDVMEIEFDEMRLAHLATGNQVGIELFEFSDTPDEPTDQDPKAPGYFHACVIDPDVEGLAERIDESGGEHYSEVWQLWEDDEEYVLTYCRDPWGNLLEIYSHSHERMFGNRGD
jgi:catechol 2,3-dioxygenase-like lactoylglutathione lyase family enzyme